MQCSHVPKDTMDAKNMSSLKKILRSIIHRNRIAIMLRFLVLFLCLPNSFSFQNHLMTTSSSSLRWRTGSKTPNMAANKIPNPSATTVDISQANDPDTAVGIMNMLNIIKENQPLQRKHERILFAFYLLAGLALAGLDTDTSSTAQATIALVWMSFSLAISFMEAWVKFKAPLLRKYVAVDVGRHVFAAQHSVELGLLIAFWTSAATNTPRNLATYYPAMVSSALYLVLSFIVGPLLYFRAKYKMVNEAVREHLTTEEKTTLNGIAREIEGKQLPDARWHVIYVFLDLLKVVGLGMFAKKCLS